MLNFLEDYVVKHFNEEESIQKKNNYPGYELQHIEHQKFKNGLSKLRKIIELDGIKASSIIIIQQRICNWWINHISKEDMELGKFLCE
ncbi:hemerythrin family protein [Clostridium lacusfryxellense]|uniref:hemerythrin family protein n=1 Tax=Clostridium lacusfryxellense TaxID=205328 RepID=UPI001C0BEED7|nr:hemerythrin family protein [Clostridium lacusfryxellense]MBU3110390.1 hemerythrin family protein [Clostridium lacusfryxellense]